MAETVLIVEDEFLIALEMQEVVNELGHQCVGIADDMESAISHASETLDVALVDVNLADGATGPQIGRKLCSDYNVEVIFVTANPQQLGDGVEGAIGALEKPVDVSVLKEVLDYAIKLRRGAAPTPPPRLKVFES